MPGFYQITVAFLHRMCYTYYNVGLYSSLVTLNILFWRSNLMKFRNLLRLILPVIALTLVLAVLPASAATASMYDLNRDGSVDIADVTALLDFLAGSGAGVADTDLNGDKNTDIADVTALLDYLAGGAPVHPTESIGLEFTQSDDGNSYFLSGIGTCTDSNVIVPAAYNGKPVIGVKNLAFLPTETAPATAEIRSIVLPESVTEIGDGAFAFCINLTDISLGGSVERLGANAFYCCTSLSSVTLSESLESIDMGCFSACDALKDVYYDGSYEDWQNVAKDDNGKLSDVTVHYAKGFEDKTTPTVTATFKNGEEIVKTETVYRGGTVTAPAVPVKEGYRGYWDHEDLSANIDFTVYALFVKQYTVDFFDDDGRALLTQAVDEGADALKPIDPERTGYRFLGWGEGVTDESFLNVHENLVFTAQYKKLTLVEFIQATETASVYFDPDTESPAAPEPSDPPEGYHFTGWDTDPASVTEDSVIRAQYEPNVYTVNFIMGNGTVIDTQQVLHGQSAVEPAHEAAIIDGKHAYEFLQWNRDFSSVKNNMTVIAEYVIASRPVIVVERVSREIEDGASGIISVPVEIRMYVEESNNNEENSYRFLGIQTTVNYKTNPKANAKPILTDITPGSFADRDDAVIASEAVASGRILEQISLNKKQEGEIDDPGDWNDWYFTVQINENKVNFIRLFTLTFGIEKSVEKHNIVIDNVFIIDAAYNKIIPLIINGYIDCFDSTSVG